MTGHDRRRTPRGVLATATVTVLMTLIASPASADPPLPGPSTAEQQLSELNHQAEVLTEQWHHARYQLDTRRAELERARADLATASASGARARAVQDQYRGQVDRLASASFRGSSLNPLSALLVSGSPEEFLDHMAVLDLVAADSNEALSQLAGAVSQARQAEQAAAAAMSRASRAERDAALLESDLARAREDMDAQIALVKEQLAKLSADERESLTSGGVTDFVLDSPPASGAASSAVQAALSRQGSPYQWGAEGPDSFDCSGLMVWSYRQTGVNLPHSSHEQAQMGS
ncbi:MAG: C40 family peptidase, partial [Actinomycetota bacterium]|nr:C40 family peptidase [Actinomycetota bacterium]